MHPFPFDYTHAHFKPLFRYASHSNIKAGCKLTCSVYLLADLLRGVGDTAGKTVGGLTDTLGNTVGNAGKNVGDATPGAGETINNSTGKVGDSTKTVGKTAQDPIGSVGGQKQTANNPLGLSK